MFRVTTFAFCAVSILAMSPPAVAEKVALRAANGRFLRAIGDGSLRAEGFVPSDKECFELVSHGQREVTLRGPGGRYLVPDPHDGHTPRLGAAGTQPAGRETFELVPVEAGRFALRPHGSGPLLVFAPAVQGKAGPKKPADPELRETVEIYRIGDLPATLKTALPIVIRGLAAKELMGKQYDKTQKREIVKYVELPAPTFQDPKRTKRHQVLGITAEYRILAQLDGQADIRIPAMSLLANYADGGPGLILLAVDAGLPIRGQVECQVPDVAGASTGYRMTVQLSAVAEVVTRHAGNDVTFDPPTVCDLHVSVSRLAFSNDLLETVRRQIRLVINHELAHNEGRIRESANRAVQKAMSSREIRIPLIGYSRLF